MNDITGEVMCDQGGERPFRAVVRRGGKILLSQDARTLAEARQFLTRELRNATIAERRCGKAIRPD
jgi:hypothetical protein